jgi:hypothetical protein
MSNLALDILETPRTFWKEGVQFINRSQKREYLP